MLNQFKMLWLVLRAVIGGRDLLVVARNRRGTLDGRAFLKPNSRLEMLRVACEMLDVDVRC